MQNAQRDLSRYGKQLQNLGANLTAGLTLPLAGLGALAVDAAADFETLNATLDTVFKGNEAAAKQAFDQITEFTSKTPFQLEEVADGFIKLKNLGLDPSIDALRSYGNTASALGKSLNDFIEAVADASVNEFERLKEFGIKSKQQGDSVAFTFQGVTTVVKKNSEDIEKFLQDIGNTEFAGGIEKQANTFKGVISTLRDNAKLLLAEFGEPILEVLKPLAVRLSEIATRFRELSPETKKFIVILGGVAAAIGPLLALAGTILPAIGTGLTLLTGPIGLVVAGLTAIGVVIYRNWEPIRGILVDIANYFIDLYNESTIFRIAVEGVVSAFKNIFDTGKFVFEFLGALFKNLGQTIKTTFGNIGELLKAVLTGNIAAIPALLAKNFKESTANFKEFTQEIQKDFGDLSDSISLNNFIASTIQTTSPTATSSPGLM
ncbi:MAG: tape measure protein [Bacteroidota bacterium]